MVAIRTVVCMAKELSSCSSLGGPSYRPGRVCKPAVAERDLSVRSAPVCLPSSSPHICSAQVLSCPCGEWLCQGITLAVAHQEGDPHPRVLIALAQYLPEVSPWRGGCDVSCPCNRGGTGRRAWYALPCPPRRRVSCHLSSQGEERRAVPLFLCNLLKTKAEGKTLPAGIGFALSWSGARTHVAPTHCGRRETCNHQVREEGS
jgi:hypothetical protein